ncbi:MAG: hypothetical protein WBD99_08725 [Thermodesulfobacteriota bacterium]
MVKIVVMCLILALGLALGCDDDGGSRNCVSVFELDNSECLAEDLLSICPRNGGFNCKATFPDGTINLSPPTIKDRNRCMVLDCQTIECNNFPNFPDLNFANIVFADLNIVEGPEDLDLEGIVITDEEEAQLGDCIIFVP